MQAGDGSRQAPSSRPAYADRFTVAALSLPVVRMSPRLAVMYSTGVSVLTLTAGRIRATQPLDNATISSRRHSLIEPGCPWVM